MLTHLDPLNRFTGRAADYARHRPDYPEAAVEFILATAALQPDELLVDVGAGTGIASRLFAARGLRVLGIEPNEEMRSRAESTPAPAGAQAPVYQAGSAEATQLPDGIAGAVLAAQAFHWFEPQAALREFHRILRPNGWLFLLWNERESADPGTAAYGAVVRTFPGAPEIEKTHRQAGEVLLSTPLFQDGQCVLFGHFQDLDEAGLFGRAFSVSYAPTQPDVMERVTASLRQVFNTYQQGGRVRLVYQTTVFAGRRG